LSVKYIYISIYSIKFYIQCTAIIDQYKRKKTHQLLYTIYSSSTTHNEKKKIFYRIFTLQLVVCITI
jgi:hypothetical protein